MVNDSPRTFAELLRRARRAAGLTQEALAERAGLSVRGISDLERGLARAPRKNTLDRLTEALGLSADERRQWEQARQRLAIRSSSPVARSSTPATPTHVPLPPTTFVGRERELHELTAILQRPEVRLLTLTGPGGVGKTRLALAVAERLGERFADGVVAVSLASLRDPELVASTIAATLDVPEMGSQPPEARLAACLADRQMLLLLDNFEHVVEAAPLVARLLAGCRTLTALVTSRSRLRLSGEQEVAVAPLALPDGHSADLVTLRQCESVALFVQRATDRRASFELTEANAAAVAGICRRLDGLPLAIELAAVRVNLLTPQAILPRLEHRLPLLTGGPRDMPARQQTVRDTIAWSYDLLSPAHRQFLRQLAVFSGGWTLEAADAIRGRDVSGGAGQSMDTLDALTALVDQSLVRVLEQPDGSPRYTMLETIREFGLEQLAESGEATLVHERCVALFRALVERALHAMQGPTQDQWLHQLDSEHDNLRLVLDWTLDHGQAETALQIAHGLGPFWHSRGHLHEARRWLEAALAAGDDASVSARAAGFSQLGMIAREIGDLDDGERLLSRAVVLSREGGDALGLLVAISNLAWIALYRGKYGRAHDLQEEALSIARASDDSHLLAGTLVDVASGMAAIGEYPLAQTLGEESLRLTRAAGDRRAEGRAVLYLGLFALWQGDIDRAADLADMSLAIAEELDDSRMIFALELLGYIALERGDNQRAATLFRESLRRNRQSRALMRIAVCFEGLAGAVAASGDALRGARLLGAAAALREGVGSLVFPGRRDRYERTVRVVRAGLADETYTAGLEDGGAMSLDDALLFALEPETIQFPDPIVAGPLSSRELDVVRLLAEGRSNQEIAAMLFISPNTVSNHVANIMNKLGLESRTAVATWAVRQGLA